MFQYPYNTTALAPQEPKALIPLLQAAVARRELIQVDGHPSILEVPPTMKDIKPFFHPVVFESFGRHYVVIDTRPLVRLSNDGRRVVLNQGDYNNVVARARLTYMWSIQAAVASFQQLGDVPARTYTRVIAEAISHRLGMSAVDYIKLTVATAFFYYSQFEESGREVAESELLTLANKISRVTKIQAQVILPLLTGARYLSNISEYCAFVQQILGNTRAESLNPPMLFTMLGGMWFGVDNQGTMRAALEYPPYFIAVCYTAATDRSFNKSKIGKEVQTYNQRNNALPLFAKAVEALMEDANHV